VFVADERTGINGHDVDIAEEPPVLEPIVEEYRPWTETLESEQCRPVTVLAHNNGDTGQRGCYDMRLIPRLVRCGNYRCTVADDSRRRYLSAVSARHDSR
jgi:hypothetical protein